LKDKVLGTIWVNQELIDDLNEYTGQHDVSKGQVVRQALREFLGKAKKATVRLPDAGEDTHADNKETGCQG
jgi:hypothetical protein